MAPMMAKRVKECATQSLISSWRSQECAHDRKKAVSSTLSELHRLLDEVDPIDANNERKSSCWDAVLARCQSHPREVITQDHRGRTCLLSACAKNPPVIVVETMLERCRVGADALRDKTGFTAMTIAIRNHASLKVVTLLAQRSSLLTTADHQGNTPLHLACQDLYKRNTTELVAVLLDACPCVAKRENSAGKTPLHAAIESKAPLDIVRILVQASPESVVNNTCGRTPLVYAIQNVALQTCRILIQANPKVTRIRDENGRLPLRCALADKIRDPKLVELLCTSEEAVLDSDRIERNALHLSLERNVNPCIVEMLLQMAPCSARAFGGSALQRCYNKFVQAGLKDYPGMAAEIEKSWTVLSMVLRAHEHDSSVYSKLHAALASNAPVQVIARILDESPEEIRLMNAQGRYPLEVACEMHADFETKDEIISLILEANRGEAAPTLITNEREKNIVSIVAEHGGISAPVIQQLIRLNPFAVTRLDPRHKLYPFMIAALPKQNQSKLDDCIQVGAIFELLLASPDLIKPLSHTPSEEEVHAKK